MYSDNIILLCQFSIKRWWRWSVSRYSVVLRDTRDNEYHEEKEYDAHQHMAAARWLALGANSFFPPLSPPLLVVLSIDSGINCNVFTLFCSLCVLIPSTTTSCNRSGHTLFTKPAPRSVAGCLLYYIRGDVAVPIAPPQLWSRWITTCRKFSSPCKSYYIVLKLPPWLMRRTSVV